MGAAEWIAAGGLLVLILGNAAAGFVAFTRLQTRFEEHEKLPYHAGEATELRELRAELTRVREELARLGGTLTAFDSFRGK